MNARIEKCSDPLAWWAQHVGCVITILWTDQYGHWTRDTGPMRCLQWVRIEDASQTFDGGN